MKVLVFLCVTLSALDRDDTNVFDKMSFCGNSFGSHSARCQANNDFKSLVQAQKQKVRVNKDKIH